MAMASGWSPVGIRSETSFKSGMTGLAFQIDGVAIDPASLATGKMGKDFHPKRARHLGLVQQVGGLGGFCNYLAVLEQPDVSQGRSGDLESGPPFPGPHRVTHDGR